MRFSWGELSPQESTGRFMPNEKRTSFLFLLPAFVLFTAIFMYPTIYSLYVSFSQYNLMNLNFPRMFIGFDNYLEAFSDPLFWSSLRVTGKFIGIAVPIELVIGIGLALAFQREFRGIRIVRTIFLIPMMVTPVIVGLTWRFMLNPEVGIIDYILRRDISWLGNQQLAIYVCILVDIWQWTPFMFLIAFAGLRSLPIEPFEAAIVDGGSRAQIFWFITLPLLSRILLVAITLRFLDTIKIFDTIYVMTKGGPVRTTETLSIWLYRVGLRFFHIGYAAAISWIFLAIALGSAIVLLKMCRFKI